MPVEIKKNASGGYICCGEFIKGRLLHFNNQDLTQVWHIRLTRNYVTCASIVGIYTDEAKVFEFRVELYLAGKWLANEMIECGEFCKQLNEMSLSRRLDMADVSPHLVPAQFKNKEGVTK